MLINFDPNSEEIKLFAQYNKLVYIADKINAKEESAIRFSIKFFAKEFHRLINS